MNCGSDGAVMQTPRSLDLEITGRCNLRCSYCSHFTSAGDVEGDLPGEEWRRFFAELNRCAVLSVCLCGGEPFIRNDLKEIIDGIVRNRMRFSILTNGALVTEEMADHLAATRRCDSVQVSLDGSVPEIHDSFRGQGTFSRAVEGIGRLRKSGIPVTVRVTIHRRNVADLEAIAEYLLERVGIPGFSTNSASYMGICRQNTDAVALQPAERTRAMETLLRLVRKYNGRISASAGPLAEGRDWLAMEKARREGQASMPGRGYLTGCNGPKSRMNVRADGMMTPCGQMNHIELGRINSDDLRQVWREHPELRRIRERGQVPLESFDFCRGCDYIPYCTGNCPALAYTTTGQDAHPSPDACLRQFLEGGGQLPREDLQ